MANPAHYFGFRPVRHNAGGTEIRRNTYDIASGLAANIYTGDPVASTGSGTITIGTPGSASLGVFMGVQYTAANGQQIFSPYWATGSTTFGSAVAKAIVVDDPDAVFLIRTSGTINAAHQLLQSAYVIGTGSATTGQSGANIGATGGGTDVRILRVVEDQPQPGFNTTTGDIDGHSLSTAGLNALCEVKLSNHLLG